MSPVRRPPFSACLLLSGILLSSAISARAQQLPSHLSDAEFWKIVSDYSEPTGTFPSENFASNETGFQHVIPELQRTTKPGGVYIGVGPEQNFTYIAALHPQIAFIVDIRRQAILQHLIYKAAFELADNRAAFLALLFSRPQPTGLDQHSTAQALMAAYDSAAVDTALVTRNLVRITDWLTKHHGFALDAEDLDGIKHVYEIITRDGVHLTYSSGNGAGGNRVVMTVIPPGGVPLVGGGRGGFGGRRADYAALMTVDDGAGVQRSYLANEENYRVVRDLEVQNMLVPVVGDVSGPKALRSVAQYLTEHHAVVTAYYTSNVEQYLFQHGVWQQFYANVAQLPIDSTSTFIRSLPASEIGSIGDLLAAVTAGRISAYAQLRDYSHQ